MKKLCVWAVAALLMAACTPKAEKATDSGLLQSKFQTEVDGKKTDLFTLRNKNNMEVCITNFGGRIVSVMVPDKDGQMYYVNEDKLYLIPTAEVPVTNLYRDMIVDADQLPIKNTAYSACFRREAGSYGKDVRGLNRLHQFDKVEIVQITRPEVSYEALEGMVKHVESLLIKLGLPYRIVRLCGGDISFTSALTFDFEVYSKAQEKWLEVSSVSNFEEFQANRLKLRFKDKGDKKTTTCHTLNGSSLALPRIVAALLENYQCEEGIRLPEVLQTFMGTEMIR